ncbi:MAG: hypothetical protein AB1505_07085 [Candidatus Latescibacterota bacterium]
MSGSLSASGDWSTRSCRGLWTLSLAAALTGCGGDGEEAPAAPQEGSAEVTELAGVLIASMQQAYFASLLQDSVSVSGQAGTLLIRGETWTFQHYSPNGLLFLDGQLRVPEDQFPNIPVQGELSLTGSSEGTLVVDIVVTPQLADGTVAATGTLRLNDRVWDVAELLAADAAEEG